MANGFTPEMLEKIKKAKQLFNSNPQEIINKASEQNPTFGMFVDMSKSGQSLEGVFNVACRQKGIDPNEFMKILKE